MYSIPRPNVIESDHGFSVEVLGRTGTRYCEGDQTLLINSEVLAGPHGLVLYSSSIKTWLDGSAINEATRQRVVDNIRGAFAWRDIEIEVF